MLEGQTEVKINSSPLVHTLVQKIWQTSKHKFKLSTADYGNSIVKVIWSFTK